MGLYGSPETYNTKFLSVRCAKCGVDVRGRYCSNCGAPVAKAQKPYSARSVAGYALSCLLGIVCVVFGAGAVLSGDVLSSVLLFVMALLFIVPFGRVLASVAPKLAYILSGWRKAIAVLGLFVWFILSLPTT